MNQPHLKDCKENIGRHQYLSLVLSRTKLVSESDPTRREIFEPSTGKRFVIDDAQLFPSPCGEDEQSGIA